MRFTTFLVVLIVSLLALSTTTHAQICPSFGCGDGDCVLTTNPLFPYACKCKDGTYKFEPCKC